MKSPMWLSGNADSQMFEVNISPSDKAALGVAEARHEVKLETHLFGICASVEELRKLRVFIYWPHGLDELRPIGRGKEPAFSILLHDLREQDKLVVNALSFLTLFHAVG